MDLASVLGLIVSNKSDAIRISRYMGRDQYLITLENYTGCKQCVKHMAEELHLFSDRPILFGAVPSPGSYLVCADDTEVGKLQCSVFTGMARASL